MMAEFSPGLFGTNCEVWWWWNNDVGCFFLQKDWDFEESIRKVGCQRYIKVLEDLVVPSAHLLGYGDLFW